MGLDGFVVLFFHRKPFNFAICIFPVEKSNLVCEKAVLVGCVGGRHGKALFLLFSDECRQEHHFTSVELQLSERGMRTLLFVRNWTDVLVKPRSLLVSG